MINLPIVFIGDYRLAGRVKRVGCFRIVSVSILYILAMGVCQISGGFIRALEYGATTGSCMPLK